MSEKAKRNPNPYVVVRFLGTNDYTKYHRSDKALSRSKKVTLGKPVAVLWKGMEYRAKVAFEGQSQACDKFIENESSVESALSERDDNAAETMQFERDESSTDDSGLPSGSTPTSSTPKEHPSRDPLGVSPPRAALAFFPPLEPEENGQVEAEREDPEVEEAIVCLKRDVSAGVNLATVARNLFKRMYPDDYRNISFAGRSRSGKRPLSYQDREVFFSRLDDAYRDVTPKKQFILRDGMCGEDQNNAIVTRRHVEVTLTQLASDEFQNRKRTISNCFTFEPKKLSCASKNGDHDRKLFVCTECIFCFCKKHVAVHHGQSKGYDYISTAKHDFSHVFEKMWK